MKKKNKKQPYHMKHDYQRFQSVNGYKFWAKNRKDATEYCKMMNWVIGDLVGLTASILLRGIDFVQIPTTLLSQVDSSVGGKTAINSKLGKNLIGTFYQPKEVLIDISILKSLFGDANYNKNIPNWIKELVNIVIGGSLIGLFSLFFLPPLAIKYWWLVWLISSIGILLWRLLLKK